MVRANIPTPDKFGKRQKRQLLVATETAMLIARVAKAERCEISDVVDAAIFLWLARIRPSYSAELSEEEKPRLTRLFVPEDDEGEPAAAPAPPKVGKRKPRAPRKQSR
jgi:hypothetical protein